MPVERPGQGLFSLMLAEQAHSSCQINKSNRFFLPFVLSVQASSARAGAGAAVRSRNAAKSACFTCGSMVALPKPPTRKGKAHGSCIP